MTISTAAQPAITPEAVSAAPSKAASIIAMLLGGVFVFMIGFSHIGVVHNAGHDTRHSFAFPCH
jgi:cobalt transporter subunit CbtB